MVTSIPVLITAITFEYNHVVIHASQSDNEFEIVVERDDDILDEIEVGAEYHMSFELIKP